ncbi:radical SAM protein [uncultured Prevotella sp.]|uniref:radical SAM/SPASM domain-containing protein n=1 Tax=uncultured Prevotella sp. TaxID=159272 RepID=UPI0027E385E5|nr:radical SAM protein [uncultured Prevotella sp.]
MIQQKDNKSVRATISHETDVVKIKDYYKVHGHFPIFRQVLIETRTDCNNHCKFCPHAFNKKTLGIMSWECYKQIINQLSDINYNGRIALMLSNEPLLEERMEEMIVYARQKSPRFFLDMTTNGTLLTVDKLDKFFKLGLDNININDYRSDRDKYPEKWSKYIEPIYSAYWNNPKVSFQKRKTDETLPNYAGNIPQKFNPKEFGFCNYPFRKLTIAFNGDILLCCDDFMYNTFYGNVQKDKLIDCWNNPELNKIRLSLLNNNRIGLCERCNDFQDYNTY